MDNEAPSMTPYARHVLICTGEYCDPEGRAQGLFNRLARMLGELGDYENPKRVKRSTAACLGVCFGGPILVVYPEGIWYHHLNEERLKRIVEEHLRGNKPVDELIFHRLDQGQSKPGDD